MTAREPAAVTRQRVLDVSLEMFLEQGYDRTSLREVAERLGFSKAALYYHFRAKDDILRAIAEVVLDELTAVLDRAAGEPPGAVRDELVLGGLAGLLLRHRRTALLLLEQPATMSRLTDLDRPHELRDRTLELLAPPSAPLERRVRAAAAVGAVQHTVLTLPDVDAGVLRPLVVGLALGLLGD